MGFSQERLDFVHMQIMTSEGRSDDIDERIVSDVVRMQGDFPQVQRETIAHYNALYWASKHWLRECEECGSWHFIGDKG
jgi:hypothetical protein